MANTAYESYLETQVMSADPVGLVHMLYRGAIEAVGAARRSLAAGDIRMRSHQVNKAWEILRELTVTLDHEQGGSLSRSLAELYLCMQQRLIAANTQQIDAPLEEVERLLSDIAGVWKVLPGMMARSESGVEAVSCMA